MTTPLIRSEVPSDEAESEQETLITLRGRRQELGERRSRIQRFYYLMISLSILAMVGGPTFMWSTRNTLGNSPTWVLVLVYALMPITMLPMYRGRLREVETDIQDTEFRLDLYSYEVSKQESRAEKILRLNDIQLRRYYDLNLSQNLWVFALGLFCIILGVATVGVTLFLILRVAGSRDAQVITAVVGGVGSLMSNAVAAIYLKMNASATENLTAFHSRLVRTHQLLMGNLLASRIEDPSKRSEALAALSLRVVDGGEA